MESDLVSLPDLPLEAVYIRLNPRDASALRMSCWDLRERVVLGYYLSARGLAPLFAETRGSLREMPPAWREALRARVARLRRVSLPKSLSLRSLEWLGLCSSATDIAFSWSLGLSRLTWLPVGLRSLSLRIDRKIDDVARLARMVGSLPKLERLECDLIFSGHALGAIRLLVEDMNRLVWARFSLRMSLVNRVCQIFQRFPLKL